MFLFCNWSFAQSDTNPEAEDSEIEMCLDKHIPKIKSNDKKEREQALRGLREDLQGMWNGKKKRPKNKNRKRLSQELIHLYKNTENKDFSNERIRGTILETLTLNGDDEIAKPFLFEMLDKGTEQEKVEILRVIGFPGAITGDDVYEKIEELVKRGSIKREARAYLLAQINKDKALPEILKDVDTTQDKRILLHSARTLQNQYRKPEYFQKMLPRIKELGLDRGDAYEGGDGLFWIDHDLFADYVDLAKGNDARLALQMSVAHGFLGGRNTFTKAVSVLQKKLNDEDFEVKILAAKALARVAEYVQSEPTPVLKVLKPALQKETNPNVKKTIQESINEIQRKKQAWEEMIKRVEDQKKRKK